MKQIDVTWRHTVLVWWSYMWRCFVVTLALSILLGAFAGLLLGMLGRPDLSRTVGGLLGYIVSLPVSIIIMKQVLNKRFKEFSIALVTDESSAEGKSYSHIA